MGKFCNCLRYGLGAKVLPCISHNVAFVNADYLTFKGRRDAYPIRKNDFCGQARRLPHKNFTGFVGWAEEPVLAIANKRSNVLPWA